MTTNPEDEAAARDCIAENLGEWESPLFNRPITGEELDTLEKMATLFFLFGIFHAREQMPRWMPVGEALPEDGAWVNVTVKYKRGRFVTLAEFSKGNENVGDRWYAIRAIGTIDDIDYQSNVTHWMHLPGVPKKGQP